MMEAPNGRGGGVHRMERAVKAAMAAIRRKSRIGAGCGVVPVCPLVARLLLSETTPILELSTATG